MVGSPLTIGNRRELTKDSLVVKSWVEANALSLDFVGLVKEGEF